MLDAKFFNTLPKPFPELVGPRPYKFVIWVEDPDSWHLKEGGYSSPSKDVRRVESWCGIQDQYIYTCLDKEGCWTTPVFGEHPNDGDKVLSIEDYKDGLAPTTNLDDLHPALR